ncbi:MAG: hypothetical protein U0H95_11525 [Lachnospira sp.]|mgnify:FL=1|jgi:type IV secretory pathway VirB4 component|nr:hypothetical protein [Lachnospira sp.]
MKRDKSISKKSHKTAGLFGFNDKKNMRKARHDKLKKDKDVKKLIPEEPEVPDLFNSDRKTVKSLCAADGINPNPEGYLKFKDGENDIYVCNMYINEMPKRSGFAETFQPLFDYPNTIANVSIEPMTAREATQMLDKRIMKLDSERYAAEKDGDRNTYRKMTDKMSETEGWAKSVEAGENVLFRVAFLFSVWATTLDELNDACAGLHDIALEKNIELVSTYEVHPEAYLSAAPLNNMMKWGVGPFKGRIVKYHVMDRYSLSTIFNHTQSNFSHRHGIIAGHNMATGHPIRIDPYDLSHDGYNIAIAGITGVGKSAAIKMWVSRLVDVYGYKFGAVDFDSPDGLEGEYVPLVSAYGGVVYQIKHNSENILNPFELEEETIFNKKTGSEERKLFLANKVSDVTNIILMMIKSGKENADFDTDVFLNEIVGGSINELYEEKDIREDEPDSLYLTGEQSIISGRITSGRIKKMMPTISDLYVKLLRKQQLNNDKFHEKAFAIAISGLEPYVNEIIYSEKTITLFDRTQYDELPVDRYGVKSAQIDGEQERVYLKRGVKSYFDGQSTARVSEDTQMVDIDISSLPEAERNVAQHVATSFLNEYLIKKNSSNPKKLQKLIILIDEFHRTFPYEAARNLVAALYRQARKRYVSIVTITQALTDYAQYEETKAIVKNSAMKILFKQDIMDSDFIRKVTPLTETQIMQVTQLGGTVGIDGQVEEKRKGECCIIDNSDTVAFLKVDYLTRTEAKICETDAAKIAKMMAVPVRRGLAG